MIALCLSLNYNVVIWLALFSTMPNGPHQINIRQIRTIICARKHPVFTTFAQTHAHTHATEWTKEILNAFSTYFAQV